MNAQSYPAPTTSLIQWNTIVRILAIGLIAGTLDITENLIFNQFRGVNAKMVFQYIASGMIGTISFSLGTVSVVLGVLIHYTIACSWTAVYCTASRKAAILLRRPILSGLLYGIAVYLIMNFIVLPLSAVPTRTVTIASRVNGVLALMLCIGLPVSLLMAKNLAAAVEKHLGR